VVAFDRFSRDEIVGEVVCALQQIDLSDSECRAELAMPLVSRQTKVGETVVQLGRQPGYSLKMFRIVANYYCRYAISRRRTK
jgi:hypothetical protein